MYIVLQLALNLFGVVRSTSNLEAISETTERTTSVIFMSSEEYIMPIQTAKIINNGNNQLLALPKEFFFDTAEVYIDKQGDKLIISPRRSTWDVFFNSQSAFDEDFLNDREDTQLQNR